MTTSAARFPAEWEPQAAVLIAWPHAGTDWRDRLDAVESSYVAVVAAIARFQPVLVCVASDAVQTRARARLTSARIDMARITFVDADYDDTWLRDSGPLTLSVPREDAAEDQCFTVLDFRFTGWGGKFDAGRDDRLIQRLHQSGIFINCSLQTIEFAMEGGAIDTDGAGTLLTTWQCLHQRHPDLSREQLSARLSDWLRQDRVLWLDHGYLQGDDTDAHVDTLARFAATDTIVYQGCSDPDDSHYPELQAMATELAALRTIDDRPYRLLELPWPRPVIDENRRLAASYANFLIINDAVLIPAYDDPADVRAAAVLQRAFPDREIVAVPCRSLIWQNGSLHCITMQLPQGLV